MALREVLAQNAEKFFSLPTTTTTTMEGVTDTLSEEDLNEEKAHGKMLIATAIVMAACKAAGRDEDKLLKYMQEDFPADRADLVVNLRTPQGKTLPPKKPWHGKLGTIWRKGNVPRLWNKASYPNQQHVGCPW
jgi:hypothetical protein